MGFDGDNATERTGLGKEGAQYLRKNGVPKGIRTPVTTVKGWCPGPLDDGDADF